MSGAVCQNSNSPKVNTGAKAKPIPCTSLSLLYITSMSHFPRDASQILKYQQPHTTLVHQAISPYGHLPLLLPLLPQPPPPFTPIRLIQNEHNTHPRILTDLLPILTNKHRTRCSLVIRITSIFQVTHKAEVNRSSSKPVQRESRGCGPVELAAECRFRQGRVRRGGHESLVGVRWLVGAGGLLESSHLHSLGKPYFGSLRRAR